MLDDPIEAFLPWRHPFLMIDHLVECVPHQRILTAKTVGGEDMLDMAHRPGTAACPGLMVLEGLNQTAALLFQLSYGRIEDSKVPLLGHLKVAFPSSVDPGDEITFEVRAIKMTPMSGLFEGVARVAQRTIVAGELAFAVGERSALGREPAPGPASSGGGS